MLNIGTNPTFFDTERSIEVNIFDFNNDIYNKTIEIEFCERIRDEVKFDSSDELVEQIFKDRQNVLNVLHKDAAEAGKLS